MLVIADFSRPLRR